MVKKILWLVVSCLMALSLVMASCGPSAEEKEEEGLPATETPEYGGSLTITFFENQLWDPLKGMVVQIFNRNITHDELLMGDWAKGLAGTGETDWTIGFLGRIDLLKGNLAESWEFRDNETIVFHIRKGVHWQDKDTEAGRFVGGREFTAEDAAWMINKEFTTPGAYMYSTHMPEQRPTSIKALDQYTIEMKVPAAAQGAVFIVVTSQMIFNPPELYEKYGDVNDWTRNVGTGPFMITDYVRGSSATYEKNPNYHLNDPLHPENRLPYMDSFKDLYIADPSTKQAAFRTGKIDVLTSMAAVNYEDKELLLKQNPDILVHEYGGGGDVLWGRVDKEELPFRHLKVRQAMNLAIDQPTILEDYYDGHGDLKNFPWPYNSTFAPMSNKLEDMPEDVQMLFSYNPEKAKQLLDEAGYPEGFKTSVNCETGDVDLMSIVREYLLDVGIDMEINPLEPGVYMSVNRSRDFEEIFYGSGGMSMFPWKMNSVRIEHFNDFAYWEDPYTREVYNYVSEWVAKDDVKWTAKLKEWEPFILGQAIGTFLPSPYKYSVWWPWVKNFHGEATMGYGDDLTWYAYTWVDEDLKKSMGH